MNAPRPGLLASIFRADKPQIEAKVRAGRVLRSNGPYKPQKLTGWEVSGDEADNGC